MNTDDSGYDSIIIKDGGYRNPFSEASLKNKKLYHIACGFGVGLSWGSVYFTTDCISVPPLVEL